MSLVNTYRETLRSKLGLQEEPAMMTGTDTPEQEGGEVAGIGGMDENTLNSVLELVTKEIAMRRAVGEDEGGEGMEDPAVKSVDAAEGEPVVDPKTASGSGAGIQLETADNVYFEMLSAFKEKLNGCSDPTQKEAIRKCYELFHKSREKYMAAMTEQQPCAAPVK
jgi:hypothetical protein